MSGPLAGPLAGLRVLDASAGAVGPWAGALLGGLGAEVIKLEPPGEGDFIRRVFPTKSRLSTTYIICNLNKRGIVLDLKQPSQRAQAHELARSADIFIENFRPGVADRIGVGYAELSALNPGLVYASACGFGFEGPMAGVGATDPHVQAFTGGASVNGEPGAPRQRWRWYGHFDCTTSVCIVQGVLAALLERQHTGKGSYVKITMTEAAMALQRVRLAEFLSGGDPRPMGSATTYLVPDQAFEARDRWIVLSATSRRQWRALCAALELEALADDPSFATNPLRVRHREALIPRLQDTIRRRPADYWLRRCADRFVPVADFTRFDIFRHHVHYIENEMVNTFPSAHWGQVTTGGMPWEFSRTPASLALGTPPGDATEEILRSGWSPRESAHG